MGYSNKYNIGVYQKYVFETSETRYILEVDLNYPHELHDGHDKFPLAPEVMCVKANMLSNYQRDLYSTMYERSPSGSVSPKLISSLYDKTKYVVHIANLQLYIDMGFNINKKITELSNSSNQDC